MKRIITAIGNEELNNILQNKEDIVIQNSDIQYQEGIIEALEKYPDTDIVILHEQIIGELSLEDLILSIVIVKNNIKIILITEEKITYMNNNIIKIINNRKNYVKPTIKFLLRRKLHNYKK